MAAPATTAAPPADHQLLPPEALARYAGAIVHSCLRLKEDDVLLISAEIVQRELAVALAEAAYAAGACVVDVDYRDGLVEAAAIRHSADDGLGLYPEWKFPRLRAQLRPTTAVVTVMPEAEFGVYDGLEPARVARHHAQKQARIRWFMRAAQRRGRRWTGCAWPTPGWAARAYPDDDEVDGMRRLARDLLWFCRLGPDDPPGYEGWEEHTARLGERARTLTELDLRTVELRGPGTSLDVRLVEGTRWLGGPRTTPSGAVVTPNFPTEESFTTPDPASAEGEFHCTFPRTLHGRVIERIRGAFHHGRLVRLETSREDDREFLAAYLGIDRGARRLGEIALVDRSSRIGQSGRIYWNTLLDENAAAHMAFGTGFSATRGPDSPSRRVNRSAIHLDVMIGSDDFEATGVTKSRRRVPILAGGEWQIS